MKGVKRGAGVRRLGESECREMMHDGIKRVAGGLWRVWLKKNVFAGTKIIAIFTSVFWTFGARCKIIKRHFCQH